MPPLLRAVADTAPQLDVLVPRDAHSPILAARQLLEDAATTYNALKASLHLESRQQDQQQTGIIPTYYNTNGPAPGAVVGIVLGSVAAFLLVVWLLFSLTNAGGGAHISGEEEIVVRRARNSPRNSNSHAGRSRRSTRATEVRESRHYSRSPRRSATIVEERRSGPPPRPRSIVVEERIRVPGDDVVEVIEEHDEYRTRRGSRRGSGYRY